MPGVIDKSRIKRFAREIDKLEIGMAERQEFKNLEKVLGGRKGLLNLTCKLGNDKFDFHNSAQQLMRYFKTIKGPNLSDEQLSKIVDFGNDLKKGATDKNDGTKLYGQVRGDSFSVIRVCRYIIADYICNLKTEGTWKKPTESEVKEHALNRQKEKEEAIEKGMEDNLFGLLSGLGLF